MKRITLVAMLCVLLGFGHLTYSGNRPNSEILIAPQTMLLSQPQSGSVTVHTFVPWDCQTNVTLDSVPAASVYSDDRGYLVARFAEADVEAIVAPPTTVLTLYVEGVDVGSDEVRVIE